MRAAGPGGAGEGGPGAGREALSRADLRPAGGRGRPGGPAAGRSAPRLRSRAGRGGARRAAPPPEGEAVAGPGRVGRSRRPWARAQARGAARSPSRGRASGGRGRGDLAGTEALPPPRGPAPAPLPCPARRGGRREPGVPTGRRQRAGRGRRGEGALCRQAENGRMPVRQGGREGGRVAGARPGPAPPADVRRAAGRSPQGRAAPLCWRPWGGRRPDRGTRRSPAERPPAGPRLRPALAWRESLACPEPRLGPGAPLSAPAPILHTAGSCTARRREPNSSCGRGTRPPRLRVLLPAAPARLQRALVFWCSLESCFNSTQQRRLFHTRVLTGVPFLFQQNYCHGNSSAGTVWWEQPLSRQF